MKQLIIAALMSFALMGCGPETIQTNPGNQPTTTAAVTTIHVNAPSTTTVKTSMSKTPLGEISVVRSLIWKVTYAAFITDDAKEFLAEGKSLLGVEVEIENDVADVYQMEGRYGRFLVRNFNTGKEYEMKDVLSKLPYAGYDPWESEFKANSISSRLATFEVDKDEVLSDLIFVIVRETGSENRFSLQ